MAESDNAKYTITMKHGTNLAPWTVLRFDSLQEAAAELSLIAPSSKQYFDQQDYGMGVATAAQELQGKNSVVEMQAHAAANPSQVHPAAVAELPQAVAAPTQSAAPTGWGAAPAAAPAAVPAAPPAQSWGSNAGPATGPAPLTPEQQACLHGARSVRNGTYKSGPNMGRAYTGYFCPTPQGTPNQCKPVFVTA